MTEQYAKADINSPSVATVAFNMRRNLAGLILAPVPGTPDTDALAFFGTLNIYDRFMIDVMHIHQLVDGTAGTTSVDIFRRRDDVMTLIGQIDLTFGGGDFSTGFVVPTDGIGLLQRFDYLYLQPTAVQANGLGLTVDVHLSSL